MEIVESNISSTSNTSLTTNNNNNNKIKKKKENEILFPIKNIIISDSKTGFVVLECIYKWSENTVNNNLGSFILSFYQFAREVDDGGLFSSLFSSLFVDF